MQCVSRRKLEADVAGCVSDYLHTNGLVLASMSFCSTSPYLQDRWAEWQLGKWNPFAKDAEDQPLPMPTSRQTASTSAIAQHRRPCDDLYDSLGASRCLQKWLQSDVLPRQVATRLLELDGDGQRWEVILRAVNVSQLFGRDANGMRDTGEPAAAVLELDSEEQHQMQTEPTDGSVMDVDDSADYYLDLESLFKDTLLEQRSFHHALARSINNALHSPQQAETTSASVGADPPAAKPARDQRFFDNIINQAMQLKPVAELLAVAAEAVADGRQTTGIGGSERRSLRPRHQTVSYLIDGPKRAYHRKQSAEVVADEEPSNAGQMQQENGQTATTTTAKLYTIASQQQPKPLPVSQPQQQQPIDQVTNTMFAQIDGTQYVVFNADWGTGSGAICNGGVGGSAALLQPGSIIQVSDAATSTLQLPTTSNQPQQPQPMQTVAEPHLQLQQTITERPENVQPLLPHQPQQPDQPQQAQEQSQPRIDVAQATPPILMTTATGQQLLKAKSLSTPRRNSHVRVLDFNGSTHFGSGTSSQAQITSFSGAIIPAATASAKMAPTNALQPAAGESLAMSKEPVEVEVQEVRPLVAEGQEDAAAIDTAAPTASATAPAAREEPKVRCRIRGKTEPIATSSSQSTVPLTGNSIASTAASALTVDAVGSVSSMVTTSAIDSHNKASDGPVGASGKRRKAGTKSRLHPVIPGSGKVKKSTPRSKLKLNPSALAGSTEAAAPQTVSVTNNAEEAAKAWRELRQMNKDKWDDYMRRENSKSGVVKRVPRAPPKRKRRILPRNDTDAVDDGSTSIVADTGADTAADVGLEAMSSSPSQAQHKPATAHEEAETSSKTDKMADTNDTVNSSLMVTPNTSMLSVYGDMLAAALRSNVKPITDNVDSASTAIESDPTPKALPNISEESGQADAVAIKTMKVASEKKPAAPPKPSKTSSKTPRKCERFSIKLPISAKKKTNSLNASSGVAIISAPVPSPAAIPSLVVRPPPPSSQSISPMPPSISPSAPVSVNQPAEASGSVRLNYSCSPERLSRPLTNDLNESVIPPTPGLHLSACMKTPLVKRPFRLYRVDEGENGEMDRVVLEQPITSGQSVSPDGYPKTPGVGDIQLTPLPSNTPKRSTTPTNDDAKEKVVYFQPRMGMEESVVQSPTDSNSIVVQDEQAAVVDRKNEKIVPIPPSSEAAPSSRGTTTDGECDESIRYDSDEPDETTDPPPHKVLPTHTVNSSSATVSTVSTSQTASMVSNNSTSSSSSSSEPSIVQNQTTSQTIRAAASQNDTDRQPPSRHQCAKPQRDTELDDQVKITATETAAAEQLHNWQLQRETAAAEAERDALAAAEASAAQQKYLQRCADQAKQAALLAEARERTKNRLKIAPALESFRGGASQQSLAARKNQLAKRQGMAAAVAAAAQKRTIVDATGAAAAEAKSKLSAKPSTSKPVSAMPNAAAIAAPAKHVPESVAESADAANQRTTPPTSAATVVRRKTICLESPIVPPVIRRVLRRKMSIQEAAPTSAVAKSALPTTEVPTSEAPSSAAPTSAAIPATSRQAAEQPKAPVPQPPQSTGDSEDVDSRRLTRQGRRVAKRPACTQEPLIEEQVDGDELQANTANDKHTAEHRTTVPAAVASVQSAIRQPSMPTITSQTPAKHTEAPQQQPSSTTKAASSSYKSQMRALFGEADSDFMDTPVKCPASRATTDSARSLGAAAIDDEPRRGGELPEVQQKDAEANTRRLSDAVLPALALMPRPQKTSTPNDSEQMKRDLAARLQSVPGTAATSIRFDGLQVAGASAAVSQILLTSTEPEVRLKAKTEIQLPAKKRKTAATIATAEQLMPPNEIDSRSFEMPSPLKPPSKTTIDRQPDPMARATEASKISSSSSCAKESSPNDDKQQQQHRGPPDAEEMVTNRNGNADEDSNLDESGELVEIDHWDRVLQLAVHKHPNMATIHIDAARTSAVSRKRPAPSHPARMLPMRVVVDDRPVLLQTSETFQLFNWQPAVKTTTTTTEMAPRNAANPIGRPKESSTPVAAPISAAAGTVPKKRLASKYREMDDDRRRKAEAAEAGATNHVSKRAKESAVESRQSEPRTLATKPASKAAAGQSPAQSPAKVRRAFDVNTVLGKLHPKMQM